MRAGELTGLGSDRQPIRKNKKALNLGSTERALSTIGGAWLAMRGLRKGGLTGIAIAGLGAALVKRGATGHCGVYEKLNVSTRGEARPQDYFDHGIHVEEAVTIQAPVAQVFAFWRDFENLARFMKHVKAVEVLDDNRSHWAVHGPAGTTIEWDAEIINEEPDRLIAWRSLEGAEVHNTGTVQFREAAGGRGTEVRVVLEYLPPAGKVGVAIARMLGRTPGIEVRDDLRRLRQLLETGEVPTTEGQSRGAGKLKGRVETAAVEAASRIMDKTEEPVKFARDRGSTDQGGSDDIRGPRAGTSQFTGQNEGGSL